MSGVTGYLVFVKTSEIIAYQRINENMVAIVADEFAERCQETTGSRFVVNGIQDILVREAMACFKIFGKVIRQFVVQVSRQQLLAHICPASFVAKKITE